ncbi:sigma-70 family RNA polymerase sigma factor [Siminovitchia sp. FSL H7-0308]|uniref:sigma-70 family RNA polymerase sigma factor n=1 Tax=Siminovitchia sp. FSL H7-0308 TaxID=2921432 RepID=UPI0030EF2DD6
MLNWADRLIQEYLDGKSQLIRLYKSLDKADPVDREDRKRISRMIDDMDFAIEWLKTGRQPGTYRGIDKKSIYQIRSLECMDLIPDITEELEDATERKPKMTREEKVILADILSSFSLRERQCFILHKAHGLSMQRIANELCLSKATVQMYISRARKKAEKRLG